MSRGKEKHESVPPEMRQLSCATDFCCSVGWVPVQDLPGWSLGMFWSDLREFWTLAPEEEGWGEEGSEVDAIFSLEGKEGT